MLAKLLFVFGLIQICHSALDPKVSKVLDLTLPSSLKLDDLVFPDTTSCNGFWKTSGLACNETLLAEYAKKDWDTLTQEDQDMNNTLELMADLMEVAGPYMDQSEYLNTLIADKYSRKRGNMDRLKRISSRCLNYMRTLRQNSLCSTCSGINFEFYRGYKGFISLATCDLMFATCRSHFDELLVYFKPLAVCWEAINVITGQRYPYPMSEDDPLNLVDWVLRKQYEEYTEALRTGKPLAFINSLKAKICEGSLRINQPPTLQHFTRRFRKELDYCNSEFYKVKGRTLFIKSNKARSLISRSIQEKRTLSTVDFIFTDVLAAIPTGVTQDGAEQFVTESGYLFPPERPMNFTLQFP